MNTCQNCGYWTGNEFAQEALCKRYPPKTFQVLDPRGSYYEQVQPSTSVEDICGEHRARVVPEAPDAHDVYKFCNACLDKGYCADNDYCVSDGKTVKK